MKLVRTATPVSEVNVLLDLTLRYARITLRLFVVTLSALAILLDGATTYGQTLPSNVQSILNPNRAHLFIALTADTGAPRPPDVRFFASPNLAGEPQAHLNEKGFLVGNVAVCVFPSSAFAVRSGIRVTTLLGTENAVADCPSDVPIKSPAAETLYVELARVDGHLAQIEYRGRSYHFNLRTLPQAYEGSDGPLIFFPTKSPPLLGGVDVPRAFRPRRRETWTIDVREKPNAQSRVAATLSSIRDFENFSLGSGTLVAAVYDRSNRWSLLRLLDGRTAWLASEDSGKFVSYERLIDGGETAMAEDWDRKIARKPGDIDGFTALPDPRRSWIGWLVPREAKPPAVPVFAMPDRSQPPIATFDVESNGTLETIQAAGDADRPIVFGRRAGWLEVGLRADRDSYRSEGVKHVWIEDIPALWRVREVHPADADSLLSRSWTPAGGPAAKVLGMQRVRGVLWLRVRVLMGEACERAMYKLPEIVLGEGWVPAHNKNGRPVNWFETYCD